MSRYRAVTVDYQPELFDIDSDTQQMMQRELGRAEASLELHQSRTEDEALRVTRGADLVLIQSDRALLTPLVISSLQRCRGILRVGVGYDSVAVHTATEMGIPVSNVVGWCADEVAEHALALLLACARRTVTLDSVTRNGLWSRNAAAPIHRIRGRTLGIIGFGRSGRAVAERAKGIGLELLVHSPSARRDVVTAYGGVKVSLERLLRDSDLITLHVPLKADTHHMLGRHEFALMKRGVILVNTSRGAVVDEEALLQALDEGIIDAAGLDVMETEPLPSGSPLSRYSNVTLTPHVASYSRESVRLMYEIGVKVAVGLLRREWQPTIVNPAVRAKAEARWGSYSDPA